MYITKQRRIYSSFNIMIIHFVVERAGEKPLSCKSGWGWSACWNKRACALFYHHVMTKANHAPSQSQDGEESEDCFGPSGRVGQATVRGKMEGHRTDPQEDQKEASHSRGIHVFPSWLGASREPPSGPPHG